MTLHAFVDESSRQGYLVTACVVRPADLANARRVMRGLLRPGDRRVHFKAMNDQRRRQAIDSICEAGLSCWVLTGQGKAENVRQACLQRLVADLREQGAQRLVLESRGGPDDGKDRSTIQRALGPAPSQTGLVHEHLKPHEDPLLWVADGVGWCYGAGSVWRERTSSAVDRVIDLGSV